MSSIHAGRIEALRHEMKNGGIDCCLVFTADEHCSEYIDPYYKFREYLSGFTGSAGTLIVTESEAGLWTDGRYFIQAERELEGSGITLKRSGEEGVKDMREYLGDLAKNAKACSQRFNIGTDLKLISAASYGKLKKMSLETGCSVTDIDLSQKIWTGRPVRRSAPVYRLTPDLAGRGCEDKIREIRKKIGEYRADFLVISGLSDIMWTFNLRGDDIEYNPVAVSYACIDAENADLFIQKGCCSGEIVSELLREGVRVRDYDDFDDHIKSLSGRKILCDLRTLNAHEAELLDGNELIDRHSDLYIGKHIKNDTECALSRKWHIEDGLVMTRFIRRIKKTVAEGSKSINEYEAAMMLDDMRRDTEGNRGLSFETISAYGANGAVIHYSPCSTGSAQLKPSGFLLVDSGGQYEGATTDITRTIALGELSEEMKSDYTAVLKGVLDLADAVFLEGTRGENLDILARRPIWDRYTDYRHGTGHGVGAQLNVHEGPQAFRYRIDKDNPQPKLEPGMITSDEPGIYLEGRYGIRIENLLLCVEKKKNEWGRFLGFDNLTFVPYEREAIVPEMLTSRQKEIINAYHGAIYELYHERLSKDEADWLAVVTAPIN